MKLAYGSIYFIPLCHKYTKKWYENMVQKKWYQKVVTKSGTKNGTKKWYHLGSHVVTEN